MPADPDNMIHELAVGGPAVVARIVGRARRSDDVTAVVAAAVFQPGGDPALMDRAAALAVSTRDRQLVSIALAHLDGDVDRVDDMARDHLVDHPDSVLVAWIAAASRQADPTREDPR
ncbi:hypothetical protein KSP35_20435 [Aquihabitans sp. G128]|uniref:hypothetical protein n=1 Tax=Aquihabitans sp. G128 TaxID=2849779 RepID=UPI001C218741|nr:hypothetical protein [Aquihabitans sp. G128]QXC60662.1 hypothetical protein KSP35_20435 [Aquihabitans sp. G128]